METNNFVLYKNNEGTIAVSVILKDETIWITQKGMAELFGVNTPAISKHLDNIYNDEELLKNLTVSKMEIVQNEGKREVKRKVEFYNLDAIIAVGYRVNSKKATQFRIWATNVLKEYLIKGFAIDKERMKNGEKFGKDYFEELLEVIKEIRLSERRLYQKITDIFETTSVDFDRNSKEAYIFFKIVQNKIHFAITGKTAAELIYERANSSEPNMGLTNWQHSPKGKIYKYDIVVAKNYLNEKELKSLERLTLSFLDYAEDMAIENKVMTMSDWINLVDELLKFRRKGILDHAGKISHYDAVKKAYNEYDKYRSIQDQNYISSMDEMYNIYLEEHKNKSK